MVYIFHIYFETGPSKKIISHPDRLWASLCVLPGAELDDKIKGRVGAFFCSFEGPAVCATTYTPT